MCLANCESTLKRFKNARNFSPIARARKRKDKQHARFLWIQILATNKATFSILFIYNDFTAVYPRTYNDYHALFDELFLAHFYDVRVCFPHRSQQ